MPHQTALPCLPDRRAVLAAMTAALAAGTAPARASDEDLVARLERAGHFTRFLLLADRAGLMALLRSPGPLTLLAPEDEFFVDIEDGGGLTILLNQPERLREIVLYHLLPGTWPRAAFRDGQAIATLQGKEVVMLGQADMIEVNGQRLSGHEMGARNGTIHPIASMLLPPGF